MLNSKHTRYLVAILALGGCSTVPIPVPSTTGAAILFVRDSGFAGSGCSFNLLVNGEIVGAVQAGQSFSKSVHPGKHRVAIENATALCPNVRMNKVVDVTDKPVVLRIGMTSNAQVIFDHIE